jgi:hypothetical protein
MTCGLGKRQSAASMFHSVSLDGGSQREPDGIAFELVDHACFSRKWHMTATPEVFSFLGTLLLVSSAPQSSVESKREAVHRHRAHATHCRLFRPMTCDLIC